MAGLADIVRNLFGSPAPVQHDPLTGFAELPVDQYPRNYSPQFEAQMKADGPTASDFNGQAIPIAEEAYYNKGRGSGEGLDALKTYAAARRAGGQ